MKRYVVEGLFWYAGDNVYIESEEKGMDGLPTEVCLNDLIKDNIKENTKVTIVIDVEEKR